MFCSSSVFTADVHRTFPLLARTQLFLWVLVMLLQFSGLGGCWSCGSPATRPDAASVAAAAAEVIVVASAPIAAAFVAAASPPLAIVIPSASAAAPTNDRPDNRTHTRGGV